MFESQVWWKTNVSVLNVQNMWILFSNVHQYCYLITHYETNCCLNLKYLLNLMFECHILENIGVYPQILGTIDVWVLKYFETIMFYVQTSGKSWCWSHQYRDEKLCLLTNSYKYVFWLFEYPILGKNNVWFTNIFPKFCV